MSTMRIMRFTDENGEKVDIPLIPIHLQASDCAELEALIDFYAPFSDSASTYMARTIEDDIPDDTTLSWDEWNAKVERLLRECGENT